MYSELIKRLREIHPEEFGDAWDFAFACQHAMHEAADVIEALSSADVLERKHGEWEDVLYKAGKIDLYMPYCSECGMSPLEVGWKYRSKFCPNCGAGMREPPKEET